MTRKTQNRWLLAIASTAATLALVAGPAQAQQTATSPEILARNCFLCHGVEGRSVTAMPTLAGQSKDYIASHMLDYKSGKLSGTIMNRIAKGYSDEQIAQIADYFAAQKKK